jgi:SAM-dependent MidA family methyltransferase
LSAAAEKIRAEIAKRGMISFARFMELALYCPVCGYYEKENDTVGRRGDFYTSVSVGSLFGELLAFEFAGWLGQSRVQSPESRAPSAQPCRQLVEAGAHDGRLARDILTWLRVRRPELFEHIEYWILEPSARRQAWQQTMLREFESRVRWFTEFRQMTEVDSSEKKTPRSGPVRGIIFSNELLDAMPVRRLGWDAMRREWFEWGVAIDGERFVWARLPRPIHDSRPTIHVPPGLPDELPDGFTTESCPAAETWWRVAADALECGKLLTIDYGLTAGEFLAPQRKDGTLRAYHQHRLSENVLTDPGEQDLTAHVNFTAIQSAGEQAGLKTELFDTQARFLTDIAGRAWDETKSFGPWTSHHTRQFQTLTHPEHLGRSFRVLVQGR